MVSTQFITTKLNLLVKSFYSSQLENELEILYCMFSYACTNTYYVFYCLCSCVYLYIYQFFCVCFCLYHAILTVALSETSLPC